MFPTGLPAECAFRAMTAADVAPVTANERQCHPDPWTADLLRTSLAHNHHCRLLTEGDRILGHGILQVGGPEAEILNLCIIPAARGRGLGRCLLHHLLDRAAGAGAEEIFLEVRATNERDQGLYTSEGFHQVGRRRAYYSGREDGLIMARYVPGAANWPPTGMN